MSLQSSRNADLDARWSAWVARGAAHERAVRRRLLMALPFLVVLAAIVSAFLVR
jgi:hypothetical protein